MHDYEYEYDYEYHDNYHYDYHYDYEYEYEYDYDYDYEYEYEYDYDYDYDYEYEYVYDYDTLRRVQREFRYIHGFGQWLRLLLVRFPESSRQHEFRYIHGFGQRAVGKNTNFVTFTRASIAQRRIPSAILDDPAPFIGPGLATFFLHGSGYHDAQPYDVFNANFVSCTGLASGSVCCLLGSQRVLGNANFVTSTGLGREPLGQTRISLRSNVRPLLADMLAAAVPIAADMRL